MRTLNPIPLALMAGVQMRVRKVFAGDGGAFAGGEQQIPVTQLVSVDVVAQRLEEPGA
jgi:hypothetical protein